MSDIDLLMHNIGHSTERAIPVVLQIILRSSWKLRPIVVIEQVIDQILSVCLLHDVIVVVAVVECKIAVGGEGAVEWTYKGVVVDDFGLVYDAEAGQK